MIMVHMAPESFCCKSKKVKMLHNAENLLIYVYIKRERERERERVL